MFCDRNPTGLPSKNPVIVEYSQYMLILFISYNTVRGGCPGGSDGHLHLKQGSLPNTLPFWRVELILYIKFCLQFLKKGSLPNTLPFLRVDCWTNTLYKICLQFLKKDSPPNKLPFLRVVEQELSANDTSGKVNDLYLYPLFADPKVLKKCSQSVAGGMFGHDWYVVPGPDRACTLLK